MRGLPELPSFSRAYTEYGGGWVAVYFLKTSIMIICIFIRIVKINFAKYSFGKEGAVHTQNEYSVYAFENVDNSG